MRYVLFRDDDTNATTPISCLERLYRPFMELGLPINLSVIPEVRTDIRMQDGQLEGFITGPHTGESGVLEISTNPDLVAYLQQNSCYEILQHGCSHEFFGKVPEFDIDDTVAERMIRGTRALENAGFPTPSTFVAPQDKLSKLALLEAVKQYTVISSGWYEWRRTPWAWRPRYLLKKFRQQPHWQIKNTYLLSHPGCLLSRFRPRASMIDNIEKAIAASTLTVLVTHWWEYFPDGTIDHEFVEILHWIAKMIARNPEIRVIHFSDIEPHMLR